MRSPAIDAAEMLRAESEDYIEQARNLSRDELREKHAMHSRFAAAQLEGGDVWAASLHTRLAVLYAAHVLVDLAAEILAAGGPNMLEIEQ